jgi:TRAP transporter TAXI family solute receptor
MKMDLKHAAAVLIILAAWSPVMAAEPADDQPIVVAQATTTQPAQPVRRTSQFDSLRERLNQNTVTVVSGNPNGTYLSFAYDLSAVLDDGDNLRVLPVIGKGGYQNVKDILHLRGIDLGLTQSNIMTYLKRTGELGSGIDSRMAYVARLYNEEMHILAGPGIESISDLSGKKVNFSDAGSGTQFSTRLIFDALGVKAQEINVGQADGYVMVKSGQIAATVLIAGKPSGAFKNFKLEPGMKLLSVPFKDVLQDDYLPAELSHADYPNLIAKDQKVETIAVGAILAVYNWPRDTDRYRRVAKFVDAFFTRIEDFRKPPRHPKWSETNLAGVVKGWKRFSAAEEWLERNVRQQPAPPRTAARPAVTVAPAAVQRAPEPAPAAPTASQENLFKQFLEWSKQQQAQPKN